MIGAKSPNGWPVSPNAGDLDITPLEVNGVAFSPGIRGGRVHEVLSHVANQVHRRVQRVGATYGNYGYSFRENVNSPGVWSNHASGTAIDFNATRNPNGVPTVECFTQAQIDEVHKILEEVNNVVRWGGDYEGTPDSMHFEIDVAPEDLEGVDIDVDAAAKDVWAIGSPIHPNDPLPELTEESMSYPTVAAWSPTGEAYWVFNPTRTGYISTDARLSHYLDPESWSVEGPSVILNVYRINPGGSHTYIAGSGYSGGAAYGYPYRKQGRVLWRAEAGKSYRISTDADTEWPWIRTVVRMGAIQDDPPWVQPPDQTRIWASATGHFASQATKTAPLLASTGFLGNDFTIHRAFGGTNPGLEVDAQVCAWRASRRMWAGASVIWWSANNSSDARENLPGQCPVLTGVIDASSDGTYGTVCECGWIYDASPGVFGISDSIDFRVAGGSIALDPATFVTLEKRNGLGLTNDSTAPYLPARGPADILEWESTVSTLVDLQAAWDQVGTTGNDHASSVIVKWYWGTYLPAEPHVVGKWGPQQVSRWWGQGGDTPENYAASQNHMGDTTGGGGNWIQLPVDLPPPERLRFSCLSSVQLTDTPPNVPLALDAYVEDYRTGLTIALRSTVRPSRYRIFEDPGISDMVVSDVIGLELDPAGTGQVLY